MEGRSIIVLILIIMFRKVKVLASPLKLVLDTLRSSTMSTQFNLKLIRESASIWLMQLVCKMAFKQQDLNSRCWLNQAGTMILENKQSALVIKKNKRTSPNSRYQHPEHSVSASPRTPSIFQASKLQSLNTLKF